MNGRRILLRSNKTRIVKLEQARGARARRYCFHFDEIAEAEAQGLPYALLPRVLSTREWMEKYGGSPIPGSAPAADTSKKSAPQDDQDDRERA
jgi:hypothetical protein